mmetsp:Transcript_15315/g.59857  ORF Transcript_15315/g.59857 Transcript_15315/m.59857 type:complete len:544 (+) Transcript_15315:50-1681(+)
MEGIWNSRRSPVYSTHGMVASTQPLASAIGARVLEEGGNAVDAAVAMAAALNVTEPTSTGIGGDAFLLYYEASTKKVHGINGSGRCPAALSIESLKAKGITELDPFGANTVTVPGAASLWVEVMERWGKKSLAEVLEPAVKLAREGHPVSPCTATMWRRGLARLLSASNGKQSAYLVAEEGGFRAPAAGEIFKNPDLATTFEELGKHGNKAFYEGRIAQAIVDAVQSRGGVLSLDDLKNHTVTEDEPIHVRYGGVDVYEMPPNGQGITALLALNLLEGMQMGARGHNSTDYLHHAIEALRLAFADAAWYVADPRVAHVPIAELLSQEYAAARKALIRPDRATTDPQKGSPVASCDTVYFSVVDGEGNAASFINSNYHGFGTAIVPDGCGFTLQNRGHNFSMDPAHPNCLAPNKRSYHTIIPGMALKDGQLFANFGVMGGFMQPQGHVQVLMNMIDFGMNPQQALDAPRFCIQPCPSGAVHFEDGVDEEVIQELRAMGHLVVAEPLIGDERMLFGRGQIIKREPSGVFVGGSDPRGDGMAIGLP